MTEPDLPAGDLPDDELDPVLQERFAVLDAVEPPVTWPGAERRPAAHRRRWLAAAAAAAVLAGSAGWALTRNDDTEVLAGGETEDGGDPGFVCPVTVAPEPGFTPPDPWLAEPSAPEAVWFGTDDLWTVLEPGGHPPRKSVWWSANFPGAEEERPPIAVTYQRLDLPGEVVDLGPEGTNANTAADGWFMIAGGEPATPGCWQAAATYKGATLSYVYEVSGPSTPVDGVACPAPQSAADAMTRSIGVTYDYQPGASPADVAASVDHVVVGWVTGVGVDTGRVWIELSDIESSSELGDGPLRVQFVDVVGAEPDSDQIVGVRALAMLHESDGAIGGFDVDVEGLWFSCDDEATAFPAKLAPVTDGWPDSPSISHLLDVSAHPPTGGDLDGGVDGPLMFSAPWEADGGEEAGISGTVVLDGDCLYVGSETEGVRTAILWPFGSSWQADPAGVIVPSGAFVPVGGAVRGGGGYYTPENLEWVVQDTEALAMAARCAEGELRQVAVVQGGTIAVVPEVIVSQTGPDAERDGVVWGVAALPPADRIDVLAEAESSEGRWVLSRIPDDAIDPSWNGILGDPEGTYPVDLVYPTEYGEILLLDDVGGIVRAYPMPGAVPSWIVVTDEAILAGRIGDGGLPDSTFVRIDRGSLEADVLLIPAPPDGGTSWPEQWREATAAEVEVYDLAVGFAPDGATGVPAESWIGEVVVDLDLLEELADSAFG